MVVSIMQRYCGLFAVRAWNSLVGFSIGCCD